MGSLRPGHSRYLRRGYLAPNERVLYEAHPSRWFYFFYPSLWLVIGLFLVFLAAGEIWSTVPAIPWLTHALGRIPPLPWHLNWARILLFAAGGLCALAVLWLAVVRVFVWPTWTYVVTDDRLIQQYGLIRHDFQEIPLRQIRDVQIRQDWLLDRARGFGTIHFHSLSASDGAADGPIAYDLIRDPRRYASPRGEDFDHSEEARFEWIRELHPGMTVQDARELSKDLAGVEWWGGVPEPVRIQREVERALRLGYGSDPPPASTPPNPRGPPP